MPDYLPADIMVRIFERLPTRSLIRFSCLSKRWNHLILRDPQFAKSQFQLASQSQTLTRKLLFRVESELEHEPEFPFKSLDLVAPIGNNSCLLRKVHAPFIQRSDRSKVHTPFIQRSDMIHYCSCNGLICVLHNTRICIWNPTTGLYRELPCPEGVPEYYFITKFGFGYVSATDDYKVFATIQSREVENLPLTLSLRAPHIWKKIELEHVLCWKMFGTLLNEALHWCRGTGELTVGSVRSREIIAFDLYKEKFRKMPLPFEVNIYVELGVSLGGCRCLLNSKDGDGCADLWVMREYYVDDSWTKLCSFKLSIGGPCVPKFFLPMETSALEYNRYKAGGGSYKLIRSTSSDHTEDNIEICIAGDEYHEYLDRVEYQETLLWLP